MLEFHASAGNVDNNYDTLSFSWIIDINQGETITETPRITRMTGPGKNRVRRNRALRGNCYVVSVPRKPQNRVRSRNSR